jgi:alpha-tubulin suppressor-like RCC1 family protein
MTDFYHDDPVEAPVVKRARPKAIFGSALLLLAGGLFLNTTLAANISLNSGGSVEFGQGIAVTAACAGSSVLTVTPNSSFVNAAGAGDYYFKSVTVSGIPSSCNGADFNISIYDSTTSSALPIFGQNKTDATVYNNAGYFQQGFQSAGTAVSGTTGAFTVAFLQPLALSSTAMRITLQSSVHKDWAEASISSIAGHACTLLNTGAVKCWGNNADGQVGDGTTTERRTPVAVSGLSSGISAISAGQGHTCAVSGTGAAKCWGINTNGQLGDNSTTPRLTPVDVSGLSSGVSGMAAGVSHTCALLNTGAVKCWGVGGRTGDGTATQRLTPVDVSGLSSGVTAISAGWYHTCAVLNTGAVRCWGNSDRGQSQGGGNSPATISGLSAPVIAIDGGERHTCALLTTGAVQCWGWNDSGQLGSGPVGDKSTPQNVSTISSAVAISTGGQTSCALLSTGTVKCWGLNGNGQLGNGATTTAYIPVEVSGLSSAVAITNGQTHACALLSSGTAKCWGNNGNGRLGDGTATQSLTPVNVTGIP